MVSTGSEFENQQISFSSKPVNPNHQKFTIFCFRWCLTRTEGTEWNSQSLNNDLYCPCEHAKSCQNWTGIGLAPTKSSLLPPNSGMLWHAYKGKCCPRCHFDMKMLSPQYMKPHYKIKTVLFYTWNPSPRKTVFMLKHVPCRFAWLISSISLWKESPIEYVINTSWTPFINVQKLY